MASESVRLKNEKIAEHNLFKAKAVGVTQVGGGAVSARRQLKSDNPKAETDAFKCSRCNQRKCTYYQMQTRSADEPMTVSSRPGARPARPVMTCADAPQTFVTYVGRRTDLRGFMLTLCFSLFTRRHLVLRKIVAR